MISSFQQSGKLEQGRSPNSKAREAPSPKKFKPESALGKVVITKRNYGEKILRFKWGLGRKSHREIKQADCLRHACKNEYDTLS